MQLIKLANSQLHTKNHEVKHNDKVKISSVGGIAVQGDSMPLPTIDGDDREGWLFTKNADDDSKFNYYIYGSVGSSHPWTLTDLKSVHMCCSIDKWDNSASVPIINVYSKPTGINDAGAWYHSRKDYSINMTNQKINVGEHINLYIGNRPDLKNDNRNIVLENLTNNGDCLGTEEILFIVIGSDSGSVNGTKILVSHVGYNLGNEINRKIKMVV